MRIEKLFDCVVTLVLYILFAWAVFSSIDLQKSEARLDQSCINQGYHTYYENAGVGYCILLGENPAIIKVYDGEEK